MSAPDAVHLTDEQAAAYAVGALDDGTRDRIADHVSGCADCASTVASLDHEHAALFELLRASADARPPGRRTEWAAVRERIVARPRGFASAWRWAAGTIGGLSAPFLFAVGVASAAGVGYAALPPVRHAVHRALGLVEATPTPPPAPTLPPRGTDVVRATATAQPTELPPPAPVTDDGSRRGDGNDRADTDASVPAAQATPTAAAAIPPSPTIPAPSAGQPTAASDDPASGVGGAGAPAAPTAQPTSPEPQAGPTERRPIRPTWPTPPARPTPDSGRRGGPGGERPPQPPPGGQPGPWPGPGPGPRPTDAGGPPPETTPGASRTPHRRERGPGRGGHYGPPDGNHGEGTPTADHP